MSQAEDLLNGLTESVINHTHVVSDSDKHFIIDPHTKQISNTNNYNIILMQGDHNSQRLTFELPRYIDGHDMSLCNRVIVHFDNVGDSIENIHSDVAYMDDLQTNPDNPDTLISSWLIRREATQIVGILSFFIQYQCVEEEEVTYEWNTDYYDDIEIRKAKNNGAAAVTPYTNVLEQWRAHIFNAIDSANTEAVLYIEQTLTEEQKAQARANIGAADVDSGIGILNVTNDGNGNITMANVPTTDDDYIVEQGRNDSWHYRKWESGVAECWRTVTATVKTTDWTNSGMMSFPLLSDFGLFWTKEMVAGKDIQFMYPFAFTSRPVETANMTNGTVWFPLSLIATTGKYLDRTDSYRICTYKVPEQDISVTISFHVIGRWK